MTSPTNTTDGTGEQTRAQTEERVTSLIPVRTHPDGPATRSRLRRTFAGLAVASATGTYLARRSDKPAVKAFGLGLTAPGGGFIYAKSPARAAASAAAVGGSIGLLWGLGPVLAPPAVWAGSAALAARRARRTATGTWSGAELAVPVGTVALAAGVSAARRAAFKASTERGEAMNERLSQITFPISSAPAAPPVTESTPEDLASLRYALDLGLQPLDRWDGFKTIDQFRESALRYQLQFLQYALATSQYTRTPAFTGYLSEAQRNSIEKMLEPKVWKYWRWENLWGNLRWDPDPVKRDNVMLSGYWAVMVGLYEAMTGDGRYNEPGSLTFRNGPGEVYRYDFPALAKLMADNMNGSPFCMFPCEPSWIYPFCNSYALNTVVLHDRMHTPVGSDVVQRFREAFDADFLQPDGRVVGIRNGRFGFNIPSTVTVSDAVLSFWLNPAMPDIAQRLWWTMRQKTVKPNGGELFPAQRTWDFIDPGNYRIGKDSFSRGAVYLAASEMGDDEVIDEVRESFDAQERAEVKNGARYYPNVSVYSNVQHILARFTRHNSMREMVAFDLPETWRTGPRLAEAAYPDVLVAKAVTDGRGLELVLRPGNGAARTTLAIERLTPGATYDVSGAAVDRVTAGDDGRGMIEIDLDDRREVNVRPQA